VGALSTKGSFLVSWLILRYGTLTKIMFEKVVSCFVNDNPEALTYKLNVKNISLQHKLFLDFWS